MLLKCCSTFFLLNNQNVVEQPHLGCLGLLCRSRVLLEDVGMSGSDLIHTGLHHALQHLLMDLGDDSQALLKEEWRLDMFLAADYAKDHDNGGKLYMHHDGNIFNVFADPPVILPVGHLILVNIFFIREEPEHPGRPMLELVEESCRLDLPQLLGGIHDEHAVRPTL